MKAQILFAKKVMGGTTNADPTAMYFGVAQSRLRRTANRAVLMVKALPATTEYRRITRYGEPGELKVQI